MQRKNNTTEEIVFGIRPVIEAIKSGKEIDRILVQRDISAPHAVTNELFQLTSKLKIPVVKVPAEKLNRITRKVHQGVICFMSSVTYASLDNIIDELYSKGETPFLLALDRVTDVRNFGAICRTAECMGIHAVIIPNKGSAQITGDAVKTSAGALNYLPVCRVDNLRNTIKFLKDTGLVVYACSEKAAETIYQADYTGPTAIVMGSEEDGISNDILKLADKMVKIPMTGNIESLNVSVAAGMILGEAIRQKTK